MSTPPRLAHALLRRALPDDARDAVDGDLHELYIERRMLAGRAAAAAWYWGQVLSCIMRFSFDRVVRILRSSLLTRDAVPSALDFRLGRRMLAKSPGLAIVGGVGMAVAVALGAGG